MDLLKIWAPFKTWFKSVRGILVTYYLLSIYHHFLLTTTQKTQTLTNSPSDLLISLHHTTIRFNTTVNDAITFEYAGNCRYKQPPSSSSHFAVDRSSHILDPFVFGITTIAVIVIGITSDVVMRPSDSVVDPVVSAPSSIRKCYVVVCYS